MSGWIFGRINLIIAPILRILQNVICNSLQIFLIPNDMFVIITLPQAVRKMWPTRLPDTFNVTAGGQGFEALYNVG